MFRLKKTMILLTTLTVIILIIGACGRKGSTYLNKKPIIRITSYEGVIEPTEIDSVNPVSFRQKIYWEASDEDGVIDSYAFRVVDENLQPLKDNEGNTIGTPGYEIVDEDGWVYHYKAGADETIPLEITEAKHIWTNQVYAVINFPANEDGDSTDVTSVFEVKCRDNRWEECEITAKKYFHVNSEEPKCTVGSTKGDINGKTIGTGVIFSFNIIDEDQFVGSIPDYFKFKLERKDLAGNLIPESEGGYPDAIWSTEYESNVQEYLTTLDDFDGTRAALILNNIVNSVPQDSTYLTAWAIDLAGIVSEPKIISFIVKEGFYPSTLIYNGVRQQGVDCGNDTFVLGTNHFVTYIDEALGRLIPSVMTSEGPHYSTPFWYDKDENYIAISSNDLKVYMKWGYDGEYEGNSRQGKKVSKVLDEQTGQPYFTEITYFDLRLDGEAYCYAPLPASEYNIIDEDTGKEWLRVPMGHEISQETILTGLQAGTHRFEVRAVDLQYVGDETPTEFVFKIIEPIPAEEKEGILVIDDALADVNNCPEEYVDSLYSKEFFADYNGRVDQLDRDELKNTIWIEQLHFSKDVFSPTDLEPYKIVVYHFDSPTGGTPGTCNIPKEYDVLNLYLRGGGNLIISGGSNLKVDALRDFRIFGFPFLDRYFGIQGKEEESIKYFEKDGTTPYSSVFWTVPYFIKATPDNGFTGDVELQIPSFNTRVNWQEILQIPVESLGPVAFFDEALLINEPTVIYRLGCKPAGDGLLDPSQYEYDLYNGQPIGLRKETGESKCYIFGFPLAYMVPDQVRLLMNQIIEEIEME
ncbi:MAG: hypothetical protein KAW88_05610 [Candidatus Cloacimonetes bacterium]|nr:hypothetical protein [Candidatus Cloacimonadota bacterium]